MLSGNGPIVHNYWSAQYNRGDLETWVRSTSFGLLLMN